jgi:tRNA pseudouridine55 synthase
VDTTGVVLLDKPTGITSFAALGKTKQRFHTRKVGHTGTLDPFASGLLVVLIGPATRCARFFTGLSKRYETELIFGRETDTHDHTGATVREAPLPDYERICELLDDFRGEIAQVPPSYSAVHVDGKRAYERARSGEDVEIPPRRVTIHSLESTRVDERTMRLTVECSSGTYIRALARDIGRAAGSAAHLASLRRTAVGPFLVDEADDPEDAADIPTLSLREGLSRIGLAVVEVDERTAERMGHGGRVSRADAGPVAADGRASGSLIACSGERVVAVGSWRNDLFHYDLVLSPSGAHRG